MENFTNILKQFNTKQRIFVLAILLTFTSLISITTTYFTSGYNSCGSIIKENRELLEDYITISQLIRKQQLQESQTNSMMVDSSVVIDSAIVNMEPITQQTSILDSIMIITQKHTK